METKDILLVAAGLLALGLVGYTAANMFGLIGTHEHADLEVYLDSSEPYDFSAERYQLAARHVHLEEGAEDANGATIHIHEEGLTLADFFTSIGWQVSTEAITTDTGETYEAGENATITVRVDGEPVAAGFAVPLEPDSTYVVEHERADG
jgi:hypothetical protein